MIFEEIPTPIALLFAGYIIGAGYIALISFTKGYIEELDYFDKFMLSLTFGVLAFTLVIGFFDISIDFNDASSVASFVKVSPLIFLFNVFIAVGLMRVWLFIHRAFT